MSRKEFNYIAHGGARRPKKLVLLFHGYGVDASIMEKMAQEVLAQMPDARVICPQAPDVMDLPAGDTFLPPPEEALRPPPGLRSDLQREWFSIALPPEQIHRKLTQTAEALNRFIDAERDRLGLQDSDIALMGFSQGGAVALYTGCLRRPPPACVVGHSSLILNTSGFSSRPPVLAIYGGADPTFSEEVYRAFLLEPLAGYLKDLTVRKFDAVGHSTTAETRRLAASFMKQKLMPR
jgi:phospholipase/carboxylesterase